MAGLDEKLWFDASRMLLIAAVSAAEGLRPASAVNARRGERYLTAIESIGVDGFRVADALAPLRIMHEQVQARAAGEEGVQRDVLDITDRNIESIAESTSRWLLNPLLQPNDSIPVPQREDSLVDAYEAALFGAIPAASVDDADAEVADARALLWSSRPDGTVTPSDTYAHYLALSDALLEAKGEALVAAAGAPKALADQRVAQLEQRLLVEGRKNDIVAALETVEAESRKQGRFASRLAAWKARYKGLTRALVFRDGASYQETRIVPLRPLLTAEPSNHWRAIDLDSVERRELLDPVLRLMTHDTQESLQTALARMSTFRFEYCLCAIERGWWSDDFVRARFWRSSDGATLLSDGHGGGLVPLLPKHIVFVRNCDIRVASLALAERGSDKTQSSTRATVRAKQTAATARAPRTSRTTGNPAQRVAGGLALRQSRTANVRIRDHRKHVPPTTKRPPRAARRKGRRASPRGSAPKRIDVIWVIEARPELRDELQLLTVRALPAAGSQGALPSVAEKTLGDGRRRFVVSIKAGSRTASRRVCSLQCFDQFDAPVGDAWDLIDDGVPTRIRRRLALIERAEVRAKPESDPALFGYVSELIPRCPDPDLSLDWSD